MTEADLFLECAITGVMPPVLFAPVTWVYLCHANLVRGVESTAYADVRSSVRFPWGLVG